MLRCCDGKYAHQVKLIYEKGNVIVNKLIAFAILENQYYGMADVGSIVNSTA